MRHRKMVIITGGTGGIGYELAKKLVEKNCAVVIAGRSKEKGYEAVTSIQRLYPEGFIDFIQLDLESRKSISRFAKQYRHKYSKINLIINNAGIMCTPYKLTDNGQEQQFAVNHLGHFYLNKLLFDMIDRDNGRIVTVTSIAAYRKEAQINFKNINYKDETYKPFTAYGQSKLANAMYGFELSRRIAKTGIKSVVVHPGVSETNLFRYLPAYIQKMIPLGKKLIGITAPEEAMRNLYYAAMSDTVENGDFIGPDSKKQWNGAPTKLSIPNKLADPIVNEKLWDLSCDILHIDFLKNVEK